MKITRVIQEIEKYEYIQAMKDLFSNKKFAFPGFTRLKWVCIEHRLF